jgi:hypothetical protein
MWRNTRQNTENDDAVLSAHRPFLKDRKNVKELKEKISEQ